MEGPLASSTAAVLLYLTWLRASIIIGTQLAAQYPTYAEWEQLLDDPDTRRDVERFSVVLEEIRSVTALGALYDVDAIQQEGGRRAEALDALGHFANRLGVDGEDLLSVLLHA